jgi:hypothetical protein
MRNRKLIRTSLCAFFLLTGGVATLARAQQQPAAVAYQPPAYQPLDDQQIDALTARVALYPDAILSDIFVAATYPLEVVEAGQWLAAGHSAANVDPQPWDPSVKSLTRFPAVLNMMASDAAWMNDLGTAFLNQQAQVFASVQRLRGEAIAAGSLYTTPQQQVVRDGGVIEIIPADPQTIYVPTYNPALAYNYQDVPAGTIIPAPLTFDYSCPVGPWLSYDLDWDDCQVYIGGWGADRPWWHRRDHPDWRYNDFRPGHFDSGRFGHDHDNDRNHNGNVQAPHEWSHDPHRQGPRFEPLPVIGADHHIPLGKTDGMPEIDRGPAAARDADRGRTERSHQAPPARETPIQHDVSPVREAPPVHEAPPVRQAPPVREAPPAREAPAREAPPVREAPPAPPARQAPPARSAPSGGGGAFDYGRGQDAGGAANRGNASRGGGGGGGGGATRGHR